jgi:hypothetical protein
MRISPLLDKVTAVLLGRFNPAIFSPAWFSMHEIVSGVEANGARVDMIHPEFCRFEIGEFTIQAEPQRFTVSCLGSRHEMARDLALSTFGTFLSHTPITAAGFNREIHFDTGDFTIRDEIGKILAPRDAWGAWGAEIDSRPGDTVGHGGLSRIAMRAPGLHPSLKCQVYVELQPSGLAPINKSGIYVSTNHHFEFVQNSDGLTTMDEVVLLFESQWVTAFDKADFIVDQIQSLVDRARSNIQSRVTTKGAGNARQ